MHFIVFRGLYFLLVQHQGGKNKYIIYENAKAKIYKLKIFGDIGGSTNEGYHAL